MIPKNFVPAKRAKPVGELAVGDPGPRDLRHWPWPADKLVLHLEIEGEPIPKARPRVVGGRTHTPERTLEYERKVAQHLQLAMGACGMVGGQLSVRCAFYRSNRIRCDVDNLLKSVLDAGNGIVWQDDSQVVEVFGRLFAPDDRPRVEIVVAGA